MGLIVDTSAIIGLERAWSAGQDVVMDDDGELLMPAIVWAEALAGVRLADSAMRAARSLGFGVLVGPKDEAHFRRVEGLEVKVLS